jgi:c-di-GMP-binding flagellar brake protein YcgR
MAKKVIDLYYASECSPCKEVVDRVKNGRFASDLGEGTSVNLVDISTEEGFTEVEKKNLEKVPTAIHEAKTCQIHIDEELDAVMFTCNEEETKAEAVIPETPLTE